MNETTEIIITASIKGRDGAVRNVEIETTWGNWQGNVTSYAGRAARHRRIIGQQKGERAVVPSTWQQK